MKKLLTFYLLAWFSISAGYSQDTLSVFFRLGDAALTERAKKILHSLPVQYDLSNLEQVIFAGMADTTGNSEQNLKLSLKRAENTAHYCKTLLPEEVRKRIIARGEMVRHHDAVQNRRVDVILIYKELIPAADRNAPDTARIPETPDTMLSKCLNPDYRLLQYSMVRRITQGKRAVVMIESPKLLPTDTRRHYFTEIHSGGKITVQPVKWTKRTTGKKWWGEQRFVTTIPAESYDRAKIFTLSGPPCDSCAMSVVSNTSVRGKDSVLMADIFLMNNLQVLNATAFGKRVNVRVPREYVHPEEKYYEGCTMEKTIRWKGRGGKKHRYYYYTKLPAAGNVLGNITRIMDRCGIRSDCDTGYTSINCAGCPRPTPFLSAGLEAGVRYFPDSVIFRGGAYAEAFSWRHDYGLFAGIDQRAGFSGAIRYNLHLRSVPAIVFDPFSGWEKPAETRAPDRFLVFQLGTELRLNAAPGKLPSWVQDVHAGVALVSMLRQTVLPAASLQAGIARNYTGESAGTFYPVVQFNVQFRLWGAGNKLRL